MNRNWIIPAAALIVAPLFSDGLLSESYVSATTKPAVEVKVKVSDTPVAPQYDNRFGFSVNRLRFEKTKADSMYFGLDVWGACGYTTHRKHHRRGWLTEAEARLGYNYFYNGRDHFSPFIGGGYIFSNMGNFRRAKIPFASLGFAYMHEFTSVFGLGASFKGIIGRQVSNSQHKGLAYGFDGRLPFSFRFGDDRSWDVTVEPFYVYLKAHHATQGLLGGLLNFGYRF